MPHSLSSGRAVHHLGAEEADGRQVLAHLRLDDGRIEALAGIIIDEQRAVGTKLRPEEAGRGVGQHLIFPARDVEPEDVRDAGVIGIAEKRLAVRGEGEILRHGGRKR